MTGLDVAVEIRKIRAGLPVALVTGFLGDESVEARAQAVGVCAFVCKPFTPETLGQAVQSALEKARSAKGAAHAEI
jgi:FixJ family two-component response regulator